MNRKEIYFIRHGRSLCNELREQKNPLADKKESTDTELSALGIKQAESLSTFARKWCVECVMSSPLRRALLTASLVFSSHPSPLPLHVCSVLREIYWEDFESRGLSKTSPREFLSNLETTLEIDDFSLQYLESDNDYNWNPMTEESLSNIELRQLAKNALDAVLTTVAQREEKRIAVVTHWGVLNRLFHIDAKNCCAYKIIIDVDENGSLQPVEAFLLDEELGDFLSQPDLIAQFSG